ILNLSVIDAAGNQRKYNNQNNGVSFTVAAKSSDKNENIGDGTAEEGNASTGGDAQGDSSARRSFGAIAAPTGGNQLALIGGFNLANSPLALNATGDAGTPDGTDATA